MAKLMLQFDGRTLKEYAVGMNMTIGRLPDNTVVIDNPAVSGHHARIYRDGDRVLVEDLKSTNGTFVNEQHVERHALRHGDVMLIGKHKLVFETLEGALAQQAPAALSGLGDTLYLDTRKHREMLATLRAARAEADHASGALPTVSVSPALNRVGVLRVVDGRAERAEYSLDANTSLIGKSTGALVRLRGWLTPQVAVAIARNGDGYVATRFGGRVLVNGQSLKGRQALKDGDILSVSGLTLEFRTKPGGSIESPAQHDPAGDARIMSAGERAATCRAFT